MQTQPFIFTFYSFKGGVGRSMALLNVAHSLVARGRDVLVLDLDLEAPGITGFLQDNEELGSQNTHDILDLVAWAKDFSDLTAKEEFDTKKILSEVPPFESFVVRAIENKLTESKLGRHSRLDVVGSRLRNDSYLRRLEELGLGSLTKDRLIRISRVLREVVRAARVPVDIPDYFPQEVTREKPYDYVLVDSRTGFTEIGGLCVGPLADRVLLFTSLNEQNICGTKHFIDTVGLEPVADPANYVEDPKNRKKPSLIVASPVPYGDISCRDDRLAKVMAGVGPVAARLTYHLQMALRESNFVREYPTENLAAEYRHLTERVMEFVGDDANSRAREVRNVSSTAREKLEREETTAIAQGRIRLVEVSGRYFPLVRDIPQKHEDFTPAAGSPSVGEVISKLLHIYAEDPFRAETLLEEALPHLKEESLEDFVATDRMYEVLTRTGPSFERWRLWANWGKALRYCVTELRLRDRRIDATISQRLLEQAQLKVEQAEASKRKELDLVSILPLLAGVLSDQARNLPLPDADAAFERSRSELERVLQIAQQSVPVVRDIGHSYRDQAEIHQDGAKSDGLFASAYAAYQDAESRDIYHQDVSTPWSWARALQFHARKKSGEEMHKRFKMAYDKFKMALSIPSDKRAVIDAQWGEALLDEAKRTFDEAGGTVDLAEAERILGTAMSKLEANRAAAERDYPEIKKAIAEANELAKSLGKRKAELKELANWLNREVESLPSDVRQEIVDIIPGIVAFIDRRPEHEPEILADLRERFRNTSQLIAAGSLPAGEIMESLRRKWPAGAEMRD